ncbi:microtubule associated protein-domain-containing protein [Syncephalastrum racemosum]|uniref:Microtubule associated protein-domain-containing protein n=1 Tax=Syncephalastrum racemosum TaxID=13706 RepID=A0A1X2H5R2_SYNRA|nr:microtubule associated protein-domain-containing protein [Syncephalastrum racemosum]
MELLHSKITKLNALCASMEMPIEPPMLKHVLYEMDRLLAHEEFERRILTADIEDVLNSIERACQILGVAMANMFGSGLFPGGEEYNDLTNCPPVPTFSRLKALKTLDSRLSNEVRERRKLVKKWLSQIKWLAAELGQPYRFRHYKEYDSDLSWGTVQDISCALRDMRQAHTCRQAAFELAARAIHYFWTVLDVQPDTAQPLQLELARLCDDLPPTSTDIDAKPSKHLPTNYTFVYYCPRMSEPLRLTPENITALTDLAAELEKDYNTRIARYRRYVASIENLWENTKVPSSHRCTIYASLRQANLEKLEHEFDKAKVIVSRMTDEYIDKSREKLEHLWDAALLTQEERADFMARLHEKADTMDEVERMVTEHMDFLKRMQPYSKKVARLMNKRKELIQKMIDFEKTASDPNRLKGSSFRLNEEERWRKTCFPTLLSLDDALWDAVVEFERALGRYFFHDGKRYLDVLRDEIADRAANQTFFGFLDQAKEGRPAIKGRPASYAGKSRTNDVSPMPTTSTSTSSIRPLPPSRAKTAYDGAPSPSTSASHLRIRRSVEGLASTLSIQTPSPTSSRDRLKPKVASPTANSARRTGSVSPDVRQLTAMRQTKSELTATSSSPRTGRISPLPASRRSSLHSSGVNASPEPYVQSPSPLVKADRRGSTPSALDLNKESSPTGSVSTDSGRSGSQISQTAEEMTPIPNGQGENRANFIAKTTDDTSLQGNKKSAIPTPSRSFSKAVHLFDDPSKMPPTPPDDRRDQYITKKTSRIPVKLPEPLRQSSSENAWSNSRLAAKAHERAKSLSTTTTSATASNSAATTATTTHHVDSSS